MLQVLPNVELLESRPRADSKSKKNTCLNKKNNWTSNGQSKDCLGEDRIGKDRIGEEKRGEDKRSELSAEEEEENAAPGLSPEGPCGGIGGAESGDSDGISLPVLISAVLISPLLI